MFALNDQHALVFGGSGGIGLHCARAFLQAGVSRLLLVSRNPDTGAKAARDLSTEHPIADIRHFAADARSWSDCQAAVEHCLEAFHTVDLLLNTAGGDPRPQLFSQMAPTQIEATVEGSLLSALLPARAIVDHMSARRRGVILCVASDAGKVSTPGETVIGAAMAGVMMFTRALANELKRSNIRVNCLSPSIVRGTRLYHSLMSDPFCNKIFSKALQRAELGVVEPQDLAQLAVYLASPSGQKITAQVISVNAGIST